MKHVFTITKAPERCPSALSTDGAFAGNGDLGIVWGGTPDKLCLYITKADFWKSTEGNDSDGGPGPIAKLKLKMPSLFASPYHVEEDIDNAEIRGTFSDAVSKLDIRTVVLAKKNIIYLELKISGVRLTHSAELDPIIENNAITDSAKSGNVVWVKRGFSGEGCLFDTFALTAMKLIDAKTENGARTYRYVIGAVTNHDTASYESKCIRMINEFTADDLQEELCRHKRYWREFWQKSSVELPDENIEKMWYMGQYVMACCSGNEKFPPGLFGNMITQDKMAWHSDYHLNYNYQAPFYHLASSNHVELLDCYHSPLEAFIPEGERFARELLGCRGIYFPVGLGPLGMNTSKKPSSKENSELFLGQKTDASYAAVVFAMRWYATYDKEYAQEHSYPYMKKVAQFWEDYLVYEDGRYVDYNDAAHEVHYYTGENCIPERHDDINPAIALGLINMTMRCLIDMSKELGVDEDKRKKWKHILDHLSPFPIFIKDSKPMFRLTEKGHEWVSGNGLDIQHVYPCSAVGLHSDAKYVEAAYNSLFMPERWEDANACSSYYPCTARMGVDPDYILDKMALNIKRNSMENGLFRFGGGGIENSSVVPATVNEMLMQSYEGCIRLFANWNMEKNASFNGLRADGAFVVSAKNENGKITARIVSERGRTLSFENPYADREITIRYGGKKNVLKGKEQITLKTVPGMVITAE